MWAIWSLIWWSNRSLRQHARRLPEKNSVYLAASHKYYYRSQSFASCYYNYYLQSSKPLITEYPPLRLIETGDGKAPSRSSYPDSMGPESMPDWKPSWEEHPGALHGFRCCCWCRSQSSFSSALRTGIGIEPGAFGWKAFELPSQQVPLNECFVIEDITVKNIQGKTITIYNYLDGTVLTVRQDGANSYNALTLMH
jgi:hypothetical protein